MREGHVFWEMSLLSVHCFSLSMEAESWVQPLLYNLFPNSRTTLLERRAIVLAMI